MAHEAILDYIKVKSGISMCMDRFPSLGQFKIVVKADITFNNLIRCNVCGICPPMLYKKKLSTHMALRPFLLAHS